MSLLSAPNRRALLRLASCVVASTALALPAQAQRYPGQSALPTARGVAANPMPAGAPRWACKTDCVVKLEKVSDITRLEPPAPLAATVPASFRPLPNALVKRTRSPVEDAVFPAYDRSDRSLGYRYKWPDGRPVAR
ncbi:MAG: hypothetical protein MUF00_08590 [Gemmatimonadaceae bacterium]|jgi:hypothetical protein|nr:hypothetical protein [Gemmatimonadaceae bacterium]